MILRSNIYTTIYDVIDRTDSNDGKVYTFANIKGATRWIKELITEFEVPAEMITAYEREYDEFGNHIRSDKFF